MFLTFIGLNNANGTFKRERSIVDEVNVNNEVIGLTIDSMFTARQLACEEINKKFSSYLDEEITVTLNEEVQKIKEFNEPFNLINKTDEGGESDE